MSLSLRPKGSSDPFYNPGRDLAYCYPKAVEEVAKRFNEHRWPELEALAADAGVTFDQLCDAMDAYIAFLNIAHERPEEKIGECMVRSKWLAQPKAAQIAIVAMLGTVVTGQLFYAIRDTSSPDEQNADIQAITKYGGEAKRWMYAHPLRTKLWTWRIKARRGLSRLRKKLSNMYYSESGIGKL